ncbi:hypothetical protein BU17DRAFT_48741 [Hysterangium stoloniferum]|nr:hypothetical protein BU17DRAFT_48741 [Hysterangium stoloniferum]
MFPTVVRLSKASRLPLSSKRANKDFYKGYRAAFEPGGRRTGAPGRHVIGGKAKYRIIDENVRYYVAPDIDTIRNSPMGPYVHKGVTLKRSERKEVYGGSKTLTGERLLELTRPAHRRPVTDVEKILPTASSSTSSA